MRRAVLTLIVFMLAVVPLTIGTDALLHGWSSALLPFAVAAAVGLTPELLPLVVSTVLASGGHRLAKAGMPVRALPAVSELGALDLLCLDKTGTLTTGELVVAGALDPFGRPDQEPLRWAGLVGEAGLLDDDPGLLDPLDEALLTAADAAGLLTDPLPTVVEVIPFDPVRRRSGAVLRGPGSGRVLVVKGAPEAVLERCDTLAGGAALDRAARAALARLVEERAGQGLRLIAVARAEREPRLGPHRAQDEEGLTLLGFVELLDEPEDSAEAALAVLRRSGIALTVLTGDHPRTALRLAQRLGLTPGRVLLGAELAALDPGSIAAAGAAGAVFARCTPEQKAQVVRALRAAGQCVGFLGDGVNDVPALRAADVGIATAGAVGAAREWADLLLGERDLTRLGRAVAVGREATARVGAYLRIALSCNLGNVLSMLAGGVLLPFLPMQPAQVLLQNLCFDAAQLSFAVSGRSAGLGGRPARLRWGALAGFAVGFGLLNSFSDIAMFEAMRQVTHGFTAPNSAAMFHTAWFTENLVTQAMALPVLYRLSRPGCGRRARSGGRRACSHWSACCCRRARWASGSASRSCHRPPTARWRWWWPATRRCSASGAGSGGGSANAPSGGRPQRRYRRARSGRRARQTDPSRPRRPASGAAGRAGRRAPRGPGRPAARARSSATRAVRRRRPGPARWRRPA